MNNHPGTIIFGNTAFIGEEGKFSGGFGYQIFNKSAW